jgi:8-oxo-dGTP diphosphatase
MTNDRPSEISAAGVVLWSPAEPGGVRVAVVHRPKYDDWSLPKGKLDPGETTPAAAVRETAEETGFDCALGRFLRRVRYDVPGKRGGPPVPKLVDYYAARAGAGSFRPSGEVDELTWLAPQDAAAAVTRESDVEVLRSFTAMPAELSTVLLVRHAKAGSRDSWTGDDDLRPLSAAGREQADALHRVLRLYGPDRAYAAPRLRCVQTLDAISDELGAEAEQDSLLSEEAQREEPGTAARRLREIASDGGCAVASSQGGVIPDAVSALAHEDGVQLGPVASKKASLWVLSFSPGPSPRLLAADYLASALPPG